MKKPKLKLDDLRVTSFVTELQEGKDQALKMNGGSGSGNTSVWTCTTCASDCVCPSFPDPECTGTACTKV